MSTNPITVSVIVPAYNASGTIGRTLEALVRQNCFQPYEVIVVDDGSLDDTPQIVSSFASVKYVRQENAGPAAARNHGARLARGEYLAFTDSDCISHQDWIALLMAGFTPSLTLSQKGRGNIGVVAGSYGIANAENWLARCVHKEIVWRHRHLMPDFPNSFGSYNFCVKKNVFDAVGGFNTAYRHASGEDNDLSYKILQSGWRIYFERNALVDHYHPVRVVKYLKEQFRHGVWRVMMYRDHPRMIRGDDYTYWKDILEMPLSAGVIAGVFLSFIHGMRWIDLGSLVVFPFLIFEILSALLMTHCFFEGILYGFVLFFRTFARLFGLSTGILAVLLSKNRKIFE